MSLEEEMILFAILQDIADELRRIEREEREAEKKKDQRRAKASEHTVSSPFICPEYSHYDLHTTEHHQAVTLQHPLV